MEPAEPPSQRARGRRVARIAALAAGGVVALVALAIAVAAVTLQGERLARLVMPRLPPLGGSLEVRSIRWSPRLLPALLTDAAVPLRLEGVRLRDPEGTVVLEAPVLDLAVPPRSAIRGHVKLVGLTLGPGSRWRFAAMKNDLNGFLTALKPRPDPNVPKLPPPPDEPVTPFVLELVDAKLDGLTATFDFPGAWGLELRDCTGAAQLALTIGRDVSILWDVTGLHARAGGYLRILEDELLPFDDVEVARVATLAERPTDILLDVKAGRTGRSTLVGKGWFTHIYDDGPPGIDMRVAFRDAADALAAVAGRHHIDGLAIGGDGASLELTLAQPFARIAIDGRLAGLDVAYGTRRALALGTSLRFRSADPMTVELPDLGFAAPGGGRFEAAVKLVGTKLDVRARFDRLATASYVPAPLARTLGGRLDGRLVASGDVAKRTARVEVPGLALARAARGGLPERIAISGTATATPERIASDGIVVSIPGATARARGDFALARQLFSLALRATADDLPRALAPFGAPALAKSAELDVRATGTPNDPRVIADARVVALGSAGKTIVPELRARLSYGRGTAKLESLSGAAFGGVLSGSGQVVVARGTLDRLLRAPVVDLEVDGRRLSLEALVGSAIVRGELSLHAEAHGPTDALTGRLTLPEGAELVVLGQRWRVGGIDVAITPERVHLATARLRRVDGGEVSLEGDFLPARSSGGRRSRVGEPARDPVGELAFALRVRDLPIASLPGVAEAGIPIAGVLSADLQLGGGVRAPSVSGTIDVARVALRGASLGAVHLALAPVPAGVHVTGRLLDRLDLDATATLAEAGPTVDATVSFRELAIEDLVPELYTIGRGRGRVTGRIAVAFAPDRPLRVDARLENLAVSIARVTQDDQGREAVQPLDIRNAAPIHASIEGDRIRLDPMRLLTDGGQLELEGTLDGRSVSGRARGHLDLELLHAFVWKSIATLSGDVALDLAAGGTLDAPKLQGRLAIQTPIEVRPRAVPIDLKLPSGTIALEGDTVHVDDLIVAIDDSRLRLRGDAQMDARYQPKALSLDVDGDLPASLLALVAPGAVDEASGKLRLAGHFRGDVQALDARARVDFDSVALHLRDFAGDLLIKTGTIELDPKALTVRNFVTTIDDEGELRIGAGGEPPGTIQIISLLPTAKIGAIHLPLRGERLRYRIPNLMEIDDLGLALDLDGSPDAGLALSGDVRIVSGRYVQDFTVRNLALSPRIQERSARPFYQDRPLLENLALGFRVRTVGDTFYVQNNLAPELHMIVDLFVGGTLSRPTLDGSVRPTEGRFRIVGMRGDFELVPNVNYVTFVPTKSLEDGETPEVNLEATSLLTDSTGVDHTVRMTIRGPIGQAAIDLSTDRGLDRNQTLVLLLSGRGSGDFAQLNTSRNATLGANVASGTELIGQLSRDTVSNLVEPYIDDALQLITGRKLNLRPTIGADGFELRLVAIPNRQFRLQLAYLRGFQAQSRTRGEGALWFTDYVTLRAFGERLTAQPQQGITEQVNSLNLELTLDFPLRLPLP